MGDSIKRGLDAAAGGRIDLAPLTTHRFPIDQVDHAFCGLTEKPAGFVKAVIDIA
jgi:threonine dehydrogenase-like Zn-dependent dehydrogenase